MTTKADLVRQTEARDQLRAMLPVGTTVRTILRHVSRSGMSRSVSPIIEGEDYSWLVARAIGGTVDQTHGGIKVGGSGFDAGHDVVYRLGRALYPQGFLCIGDSCPSNDHCNRAFGPAHESGGYALSQRWL